jgi:dimethylaniline monooxygenase (N-oxide forming)
MSKEISGNATLPMHTAALLFARAAGVEPEIAQWPDLARTLLFGPMLPMSFRLNGRDSLPDAAQRVADKTKLFETISGAGFTAKQYAQLKSLATARQDKQLTQLLANIQQPA